MDDGEVELLVLEGQALDVLVLPAIGSELIWVQARVEVGDGDVTESEPREHLLVERPAARDQDAHVAGDHTSVQQAGYRARVEIVLDEYAVDQWIQGSRETVWRRWHADLV